VSKAAKRLAVAESGILVALSIYFYPSSIYYFYSEKKRVKEE
jgi:hypothetical protein